MIISMEKTYVWSTMGIQIKEKWILLNYRFRENDNKAMTSDVCPVISAD